jgi:hypothetical protein
MHLLVLHLDDDDFMLMKITTLQLFIHFCASLRVSALCLIIRCDGMSDAFLKSKDVVF